MTPSITSPKSSSAGKKIARLAGSVSNSREATPTVGNPGPAATTKSDAELCKVFKSDLTSIRSLVTCTICDQLLYEPWTLACGHTYCYTCLCNWFIPNKRKKTCPECRTAVKQMPAPAFLVKQMVEIFIQRIELMPSDESADQHHKRRREEIADVEQDRSAPYGLFKGSFKTRHEQLWYDEEDGVRRCPSCGHEHIGGPTCETCGEDLDDDDYPGFSDVDDEDDLDALEELEDDLDAEFGDDYSEMRSDYDIDRYLNLDIPPHLPGARVPRNVFVHHHQPGRSEESDSEDSEMGPDSEEEETRSMQDFIVQDEDDHQVQASSNRNPHNGPVARHISRPPIAVISDDDGESDEGGAVSNRRPRRTGRPAARASPAITVTDSTDGSEIGGYNDEADVLRNSGWSPLDHGDSDIDDRVQFAEHGATEDESDTDTMVGNEPSDDEEDNHRRCEDYSETPHYENPVDFHMRYYNRGINPSVVGSARHILTSEYDETDDGDSEAGQLDHLDRDGDTEMSASPRGSRDSRSASTSSNSHHTRGIGEDLGVSNTIHELEENSSDSSVRPAPRRRRRYHQYPRAQEYDPRISMMFAQHQLELRGAQAQQNPGFDDWNGDARRVEPASRARGLTSYRILPPRRVSPLRNSRSPSATRLLSSSVRSGRPPRQYSRRVYH